MIINGEAGATDTTAVTIYAYGDWQSVRLRNDGGSWSEWRPFSNRIDWQINAISGVRTLDLELSDGSRSVISSDTIEYTGPERPNDVVPSPEQMSCLYAAGLRQVVPYLPGFAGRDRLRIRVNPGSRAILSPAE